MREALSAIENWREKGVASGDENDKLIKSWWGVYYTMIDNKNILSLDYTNNEVIGRLKSYFNKNKSTTTTTTLETFLQDESNGLIDDIKDYSKQIRNKYTSNDKTLREIAQNMIAK
ncbi:hypothetical protein [Vibrio mexicanus]|uniref:hypothetical protein n=1 Tax=Vibrio mexicanus TaxID=1004326 RepID=UPI00063CAA61|nr:hypothetical protein [Vibrio mexicanus]